MNYSNATKEYKKVCFSYYFNLNLPRDEEGIINDNVNYYLGIKEFLEKNFRDITNNEDNSVYERWDAYREEAKQQAKELLQSVRL